MDEPTTMLETYHIYDKDSHSFLHSDAIDAKEAAMRRTNCFALSSQVKTVWLRKDSQQREWLCYWELTVSIAVSIQLLSQAMC